MGNKEIIHKSDGYDTTIKIIGGLSDCGYVYKSYKSYFSESDSLHNLVFTRNELNLRTEKSRKRFKSAIQSSFLVFKNHEHEALMRGITHNIESLPEKEIFLFWHLCLSNRLFREISINVFTKTYFSGRAELSKEDIIAYLDELFGKSKQNPKWSKSTINDLATKYLNLMTKMNLIQGKRKKNFTRINLSAESLVLFLYFANLHKPQIKNIFRNDLISASFVAQEDLQSRLKKLSIKGLFNMSFDGVALNIELIHSYEGICNVLYN